MIRNVLLVIDRFGTGGAQTQLALLCGDLLRSGISVTVFTYHSSDCFLYRENLAGARLVEYRKKTRSGVDVVCALMQELKQGGFQAVIAFLVGACAYTEIACRLVRFRGTLIVGERNTFVGGRPTVWQWVPRLGHYLADYVVANSVAQRDALSAYFPRLSSRVRFIPNAVDVKRYFPSEFSPVQPSTGRLLVVARIVREKNALGLAKALANLHQMGMSGVTVDWVGKVHDEAYFQECQKSIADLGLIAHWKWQPETGDLLPHYLSASVFVLPSFHEGMPNVVCEALACGLPCAISDLPESSWLVDGGANGRLFDPSDSMSIAGVIKELLTLGDDQVKEVRENAICFANSRLSVQRMARDYLDLIELGLAR